MFKFNKVFLAVAASLLSAHSFAAPVTLADIDTARNAANINEAWISGASAPTYNVFQGYAAGCDADTLAIFNAGTSTTLTRPGASAASNFLAYACTRGGVVSVLYHTVDGGSFNAYAPHIPNDVDGDGNVGTTNLRRVKRLGATTSAACAAQTGTFALPGQSAIVSYSKCGNVTPATSPDGVVALPAGGFSDVEAALWGVDVTGYGTEQKANVGQAFGIATSIDLYRDLQVAQGIYATVAAANAGDTTFAPAKAPSITHAQYVSIIAGTADVSVLIPGSTAPLTLARRVPTSGTQATSNALFLRNPCNGDPAITGALPPLPAGTYGNVTVVEGSGTGNVKTALSTSGYAIGWLSMENDWNLDSSSNTYRFIKIGGVHPEAPIAGSGLPKDEKARFTAATGEYDYHVEMAAFTADSAVGTFGETVINDIVGAFAALDCADVPRGLTLGTFAGSSCTVGEVVAKGTRFGNNCQMQQLF